MNCESKLKKRLYTSVVALGLAVGSVGVAAAATGDSAPAAPAEDATEVQDPSYTGSVDAPADNESLSEADEAALLTDLATVTAEDASAAATSAVPGDVSKVELDNENGTVVYSVEITDAAGSEVDVKVDAGDGTVLDQQAGDDAGDEAEEADEADNDDIENENEQEGQNETDHED